MIMGKRIRLRPIEREDLPSFVAWFRDPEVRHGLSMHLPISMAGEEQWFENMQQRPVDEQPFAIEAKTQGQWKMVGSCGFVGVNWRVRKAELGILIGEKALWNKGYGTEAMQVLIKHGFHTLGLHRQYLRVYEDNLGAIRVYEKLGFVHEGRQRDAEFAEGKYKDVLMMSLLRPEWDENNSNSE